MASVFCDYLYYLFDRDFFSLYLNNNSVILKTLRTNNLPPKVTMLNQVYQLFDIFVEYCSSLMPSFIELSCMRDIIQDQCPICQFGNDMRKAVYHKRGNHTVTLDEKRVKIRYHLRSSPLG